MFCLSRKTLQRDKPSKGERDIQKGGGGRERERETEERGKWYCLQASWDATQFHSFTNEWHSIWMQPLWQPLCITTYQRWYSQSASILVQHYVKHQLCMTAFWTQHTVSVLVGGGGCFSLLSQEKTKQKQTGYSPGRLLSNTVYTVWSSVAAITST